LLAFVANYLALAPTFTPRAATPQESWQLPDTIPRKQSRSISAALVSAHLRTLVDEWLETARDPDGSEWPSRRDLGKALRGWEVASEFLADSPPSMYPASEGGGFGLTIAEPHWGRPRAGDFFAAQEVTAGRLFVGVLASDWQPRLCKCRYSPCGRYFVGAKIRKGYRHGTFCSREHRAHASADALTKARRRHRWSSGGPAEEKARNTAFPNAALFSQTMIIFHGGVMPNWPRPPVQERSVGTS
jgi:hypothetical protein